MHANEPLDEAERNLSLTGSEHGPPVGEGSTGNSAWHQDGQIPMSRARYHVPRIAMVLYFPQDTPVERGPTRVIPGTHLQPYLRNSDFPFALVADRIKAGTCLLIAFDIAHAALSNRTDSSRYMLKFIFLRTRNPFGDPFGNRAKLARRRGRMGAAERASAGTITARPGPISGTGCAARRVSQPRNPAASNDVRKWIGLLHDTDQEVRLEAIYQLAGIGADAIAPLRESLLQTPASSAKSPCRTA